MKEPSAKRKRTLALHDRAIQFSNGVNTSCPERFSNIPSKRVWDQLVRAADSTSNNLIEADDALSDADFLNKIGIALREAKESRAALMKIRLGSLDHFSTRRRAGTGIRSWSAGCDLRHHHSKHATTPRRRGQDRQEEESLSANLTGNRQLKWPLATFHCQLRATTSIAHFSEILSFPVSHSIDMT